MRHSMGDMCSQTSQENDRDMTHAVWYQSQWSVLVHHVSTTRFSACFERHPMRHNHLETFGSYLVRCRTYSEHSIPTWAQRRPLGGVYLYIPPATTKDNCDGSPKPSMEDDQRRRAVGSHICRR